MVSDQLIEDRKQKIALWEALGFSGYAEKFDRTHYSHEAKEVIEKTAKNIRDVEDIMESPMADQRICGRIVNKREMGSLAFFRIRDQHGDFQICLSKKVLQDRFKTFLKVLDLGDFCGFSGEFFVTKHGEPTLLVAEVYPLSKALRPLPEKWHGLNGKEQCYRERYLDLATNQDTKARFYVRSQVVQYIREFFYKKSFIEVETPILQSQAGGAMARVFETHHNALDHDFVLRIALELPLKMVIGGGFERVFEIGKCFRNEGSDPSHMQEFTMIEWYAAYVSLAENHKWNEELLRGICTDVLKIDTLNVTDKNDKHHVIDFTQSFQTCSFHDLLVEHAGIDMHTISDDDLCKKSKELGIEETKTKSRATLLDDIYKVTARPHMIQPTFVYGYPSDLKPLARPKGDGTAECFQLLIGGWEVVNSYGELVDPRVQRSLLERQSQAREKGDDEAMEVDEGFLKAMEHGFPPMTGCGIGIDRLVTLLTSQDNLRDTVIFPLMRPENAGS